MRRFLCCLALLVHIVTWVPATSRLLASNDDQSSQQLGNGITPVSSQPTNISQQGKADISEKDSYTQINKLGSRPPSCEHKCDGCNPCLAIQVPTITGHFRVQYANYEPESWKCKCGPIFYSP